MKKVCILMVLVFASFFTNAQEVVLSRSFDGGSVVLERKTDRQFVRQNRDGSPFYKTTLAVKINYRGLNRRDEIASDIYSNNESSMDPCMLIDATNNLLYVFALSKSDERMYGMDGDVFRLDMNSGKWTRERVFSKSNMGWFAYFGGAVNGNPEVWHFSFSGYRNMCSTRNNNGGWSNNDKGGLNPDQAANQRSKHDNVLVINTQAANQHSSIASSGFEVILSRSFDGGSIVLERKTDRQFVRQNRDGSPFYKTTLAVKVNYGGLNRRDEIASDIYSNNESSMDPCMLIDATNNLLYVFALSKSDERMYGMDGDVFRLDMNSGKWTRERVFSKSNMGWFAYFGGAVNGNPEVWHFSFNGYRSMCSARNNNGGWSNTDKGSQNPDQAANQRSKHDNILLIGSLNNQIASSGGNNKQMDALYNGKEADKDYLAYKQAKNASLKDAIAYVKDCKNATYKADVENEILNSKINNLPDIVYCNENYPKFANKLEDKMFGFIGSISDCEAFLKCYPTSKRLSDVDDKLYEIIYSRDYSFYYETYLKLFPNGKHKTEVDAIKIELEYYRAAFFGTIADCNTYLNKYPHGRYVDVIQTTKDILRETETETWSQSESPVVNESNVMQHVKSIREDKDEGNWRTYEVEFVDGYAGWSGWIEYRKSDGKWGGQDGFSFGYAKYVYPEPNSKAAAILVLYNYLLRLH